MRIESIEHMIDQSIEDVQFLYNKNPHLMVLREKATDSLLPIYQV
jgi:hypothetical protein